jgi:hypothetical protein
MAGILDSFNDPTNQGILSLGLGLLSAAGPSRQPVSFGQAMGSAGMNALNEIQGAQDRNLKRKLTQAQLEDILAQAQQRQIEANRMGMIMDQYNQYLKGQQGQSTPQSGGFQPGVTAPD